MKLNELKNRKVAKELPIGRHEVTFKKIDYRTNSEMDITGVFIHIDGYKPLFIPFFDNGDNFQLDLLLEQLGCDSYDPDEINQCTGTRIIAQKYIRQVEDRTFTNVSFNTNFASTDNESLPA